MCCVLFGPCSSSIDAVSSRVEDGREVEVGARVLVRNALLVVSCLVDMTQHVFSYVIRVS